MSNSVLENYQYLIGILETIYLYATLYNKLLLEAIIVY